MEYNRLKGIPVSEYEYPGEGNAFALVKKIPMLDQIVGAFLQYQIQMGLLSEVQGDCFRITEKSCPEVYAIYKKALARLDMKEEYPLFAKAEYDYNAYATGGNAPFLVIHSSMLQHLSEEELLFVLGHEIGHVKSGHLIYYNMAYQFGSLIGKIRFPGSEVALRGFLVALVHWARMQEYTADRAGALAAGSIEGGQRGLACLLGVDEKLPGIHFEIVDLLQQNAAFEEGNKDIISMLISTKEIMNCNHPWTVNRIQALEDWKQSGQYGALIERYATRELSE